jgi:molecular chaperone GrpE
MKTEKELIEKTPIPSECVSKEKYNELNDKYLRSVADYQNLKRRTEADNTRLFVDMKKRLINDLLPILDDIRLAAETTQEQAMFMIYRKTIQMLEQHDVYQFGMKGEQFDDSRHNAILTESNPDKAHNEILSVPKYGYIFNDRDIIRYADVVVNILNKED